MCIRDRTKGIEFRFNSTFNKIEKRDDGRLLVDMEGCDDLEADAVLFAIGRIPNTQGLGLEEAGVALGEARNRVGRVRTYTSDFRPMKNVLAGRNERSLYKLVVDGATEQVVGIHMIGPGSYTHLT